MKCSLLTLSTFIDDELPAERHAEVDAHLVGCPRCSTGAATLREEKNRVAQLARVSMDPTSAQSLLEQVGIAPEPAASLPGRAASLPETPAPYAPPPPIAAAAANGRGGGHSLPWTPTQTVPGPTPYQEMTVPPVSPDTQPDLPLDGDRSGRDAWNASQRNGTTATQLASAGSIAVAGPATNASWEAALPPPLDSDPYRDGAWDLAAPSALPPALPSAPPLPPTPPLRAPAPTRLAPASGPSALFSRLRDAVGVRLALSRGADAIDEQVQVAGAGPAHRAPAPAAAVASPPPPPLPATEFAETSVAEVELPGTARRAAVSAGTRNGIGATAERDARPWREDPDEHDAQPGSSEPAGWNAFAASSYPFEAAPLEPTRAAPPRKLGRHSRAVAHVRRPITTQVAHAMSRLTAAVRLQGSAASVRARRGVSGVSKGDPNSRLYAIVAGFGLIFVAALLFAHASKPLPSAPAAHHAAGAAVTAPHRGAPTTTSGAAAAPTTAPVSANAQTFGGAAGGFQVLRLRYGIQTSYERVVFDLGAVTGAATGSPKVVVSFSGPQTLLVTFTGALPSGSTGVPPPGKVISAVTLLSSANQRTVYQFQLTRAVTTVGFYLASPTRFVLDLH